MNGTTIDLLTPTEIAALLARRVRALRLRENWTRATLAARAAISAASAKRFENTGAASLDLVLRVASALGRLDEFASLLAPPPARSLAEIERRSAGPDRKRGRR
ncbi:MAG: XRE family transcriptional regulator [Deltaproteobacteria bacterium]|nr:XRE family transcriptional regulator [Deltaproteobacteria bacterium]